jgi:hypothetical protein
MSEEQNKDIFNKPSEAPKDEGKPAEPQKASTHYLDQLVGEGKKFKSLEDLARGKAESDSYVEQLKSEIEELKERVGKSKSVDDLIERLQQRSTEQKPLSSNTGNEQDQARMSGTDEIVRLLKEEIPKIVKDQLTDSQKKELETTNRTLVNEAMTRVYGDKAGEHLDRRSKELGVGKEFLLETAQRSPKAFLELMGITHDKLKKATPSSPVQTSIRTEDFQTSTPEPGSWEDYEKLRKENPALYWSPRVQKQMFEDMKAGKFS